MHVSLTPELDRYVLAKVESGKYSSASEVVREALRMLQEHDEAKQIRIEALKRGLQEGIDALDEGRYIEARGPQPFEEIKRSARGTILDE